MNRMISLGLLSVPGPRGGLSRPKQILCARKATKGLKSKTQATGIPRPSRTQKVVQPLGSRLLPFQNMGVDIVSFLAEDGPMRVWRVGDKLVQGGTSAATNKEEPGKQDARTRLGN